MSLFHALGYRSVVNQGTPTVYEIGIVHVKGPLTNLVIKMA